MRAVARLLGSELAEVTCVECGRYQAQLPAGYQNTPVGQYAGMTIHESQSLFLEMQLCRSKEFIEWVVPQLCSVVLHGKPEARHEMTADALLPLYRNVKPGLIRVVADEVTYPLHVIMRYKLERAMIDGELAVEDLPGAWNEYMMRYLGVAPAQDDHGVGCMQDLHWYMGFFGYFPSYTMGAMAAAQLFQQAQESVPGVLQDVGSGRFERVMSWLGDNVHAKGARLGTQGLLQDVTGSTLSATAFKQHLITRYV